MIYSRKILLAAYVIGGSAVLAAAVRIFIMDGPLPDWGKCTLAGGDDKKAAIDACSTLLQSNLTPAHRARALAIRGYYHNEVGGDAKLSLADFDEAIRLKPNLASAFNFRGLTYSGLGKYDLAVADFTRSIELAPQARTYDSRGKAHFKAGDNADALADYTRSVELDPEFAKAWRHRGEIRTVMADYEGARQDLMTALRLHPRYKPAQQALDRLDQLDRTTPPQTE